LTVNDPQYAGNRGYDDVLPRYYSFDSTVPNHSAVSAGDLAVLRDRNAVLGLGWIERIKRGEATKERRRCPSCLRTGFKARETRTTRYRCPNCTAEFVEPLAEVINVTAYRALYGSSWFATPDEIDVNRLAGAYLSNAAQHAIRELELQATTFALSGPGLPDEDWWAGTSD